MSKVVKPPLDNEGKVAKFDRDGLLLTDTDEETLKSLNYFYFTSRYKPLFTYLTKEGKVKYKATATFKEMHALSIFDHHLSMLLLTQIVLIENYLKAVFAEAVVHQKEYDHQTYYAFWCLCQNDPSHDEGCIKQKIAKVELRNKPMQHDDLVKHQQKYKVTPFWVTVQHLTLTEMSKLYTFLGKSKVTAIDSAKRAEQLMAIQKNKELRLAIAARFSCKPDLLQTRLYQLTLLRNYSVHGSSVYNRTFERKSIKTKQMMKHIYTLSQGSEVLQNGYKKMMRDYHMVRVELSHHLTAITISDVDRAMGDEM